MNSQQLFLELAQRLGHYSDAAVLWVFLKEQADITEYRASAERIASEQLQKTVKRWDVQRCIERLQKRGLLSIRVHANYRTHVTVSRDAVLTLLRTPMAERLPSRSTKHFAFLDAWTTDLEASQTAEAVSLVAPLPDPSPKSETPSVASS